MEAGRAADHNQQFEEFRKRRVIGQLRQAEEHNNLPCRLQVLFEGRRGQADDRRETEIPYSIRKR